MLVRDFVFFEQIRHCFGHHGIIILNGEHRNFFSRFGFLVWRRESRLFWIITHGIQYTPVLRTRADLFKCFQG